MTPLDLKALEARTQAIGRELFDVATREHAHLSAMNRWTAQVLSWCLSDPALKANVLRFIDVLPGLRTPREIARHVREYFPTNIKLPVALRLGSHLAHRGLLTHGALAAVLRQLVERVARQFIAEHHPEGISQVLRTLASRGATCSLDILGEQVLTEAEADRYVSQCRTLLDLCIPPVNLSVKPSALTPRFEPISPDASLERATQRILPLLQRASERGGLINLDMEQYELRDLTLALVKHLVVHPARPPQVGLGIVIQAYLRDAETVTDELLAWLAAHQQTLTIRLVKGAYWDSECVQAAQSHWPVPVYQDKAETDLAFERLTRRLLSAAPLVTTTIGSHNVRSIAHAMATAEALGMAKSQLEFQLLYGMGDAIHGALVSLGYPVRIYTPVGELIPGMAYLVRRILENTSNESFLRQDFFEGRSPDELLRAPPPSARGGGQTVMPSPAGIGAGRLRARHSAAAPMVAASAGRPRGRHSAAAPMVAASQAGRGTDAASTEWSGEPMADFSKEATRVRMAQALTTVRAQLGRSYSLLLGDRAVRTPETLTVRNPAAPSQVIGTVARATLAEVDQAVRAAREAQPRWAATPVRERVTVLRRAAGLMREQRETLAAWTVLEVGKTWREADAEIVEMIDFLEYYSVGMEALDGDQPLLQMPGEQNAYRYVPRGVAVVIAPWNFPGAILSGMASAALVTGNAVILKPAEQSSVMAALIARIFRESGLPPAVVQYLPGIGEEVGAGLVRHPGIETVLFTGSKAVGLSILEACASVSPGQRSIKHVVTEMGGKNAIIVDADADLDATVSGVLRSAFGYGGQKCSAASRVIVHEAVYDRFLARLIAAVDRLVVGDPADPATDVGPLIEETAQQRLREAAVRAAEVGTVAYQYPASRLPRDGYFVGPMVVTEVPPDDRLAREELFGPLLCVFRVKTFDEALAMANDSDYGLTGGVYSRSPSRLDLAIRSFEVGNLYLNRPITGALVGRQPFGGHRLSGLGTKAGGPHYLLQLLLPKTISTNTTRHGIPLD